MAAMGFWLCGVMPGLTHGNKCTLAQSWNKDAQNEMHLLRHLASGCDSQPCHPYALPLLVGQDPGE